MELFFYLFAALFSVINPLATLPIFVSLTSEDAPVIRHRTAFWTAVNVFIILLVSYFLGQYVLSFFGISINSLKIAGGLIITSSGFALLTGKFAEHKGLNKRIRTTVRTRNDISFTPLAMPILAGPGSMSLLIGFNQKHQQSTDMVVAVLGILAICLVIYAMFRSAQYIIVGLGNSGINAISRIIGFIVIAIGIEYIISALLNLINGIPI
jgi:MarC family membrane protein